MQSLPRYLTGLLAGLLLCLPAALAIGQTSNSVVVFIVDMSAQVKAGTFVPGAKVYVRGTFNGWGTNELINISVGGNSNLYLGQITDLVDVNGGTIYYKYFAPSVGIGWETTYNNLNRAARLPATPGASVALPAVFFDDAGPLVTNAITFSVNLAEQINLGLFVPGTDTVSVRGDLNGYALGNRLTNNPLIWTTNSSGVVTSNVYTGTFTNISPVNSNQSFKFWNSDPVSEQWESVAPENQDGSAVYENRYYINGSGSQSLALVDFSDTPLQIGPSNSVILNVSGQANIWAAGHTALPLGTDGVLPPLVHFQFGSNQVLVFTSVSGLVSIGANNGYLFGFHGPDGITNTPYNDSSGASDGISGFVDNDRIATLVGVFLDDTEPANPAPTGLDFSDAGMVGHSFSSLAPQLRQVFFIGDGITGTGAGKQQVFIVPPTATRLCLGIPDNPYNDNAGSFTATFTLSQLSPAPAPALEPAEFTASGVRQIQVSGLAGKNYVLQASTNLSNWVSIGTNVPVAAPFYMSDPAATNLPSRFYRAVLQP